MLIWIPGLGRLRRFTTRGSQHYKFICFFLLRKSSIFNNKANGNALSMPVIEQMWSELREQRKRDSSEYSVWRIHVQERSGFRQIVPSSFRVVILLHLQKPPKSSFKLSRLTHNLEINIFREMKRQKKIICYVCSLHFKVATRGKLA